MYCIFFVCHSSIFGPDLEKYYSFKKVRKKKTKQYCCGVGDGNREKKNHNYLLSEKNDIVGKHEMV